jgi:hypothetical protein
MISFRDECGSERPIGTAANVPIGEPCGHGVERATCQLGEFRFVFPMQHNEDGEAQWFPTPRRM